jgi:hypothetical protein
MASDSKTIGRYQRRTIDLNEDHWALLDALAEELNACPDGGPERGRPSWRALMRLIAEGHYHIVPSTVARLEATQESTNGKWRVRWRSRAPTDNGR